MMGFPAGGLHPSPPPEVRRAGVAPMAEEPEPKQVLMSIWATAELLDVDPLLVPQMLDDEDEVERENTEPTDEELDEEMDEDEDEDEDEVPGVARGVVR